MVNGKMQWVDPPVSQRGQMVNGKLQWVDQPSDDVGKVGVLGQVQYLKDGKPTGWVDEGSD